MGFWRSIMGHAYSSCDRGRSFTNGFFRNRPTGKWIILAEHSTCQWIFWQAIQPISGSVNVLNLPISYPVTGIFWQAVQPISGSITVLNFPSPSTVANVNRVTVGTTVVTLLAANVNRKRAIIFNEVGTLRVKLGANASLTDYTYEILASAGNNRQDIDNYSGIITGIKVSGTTAVQVTEI
jgi:hypothetical protein